MRNHRIGPLSGAMCIAALQLACMTLSAAQPHWSQFRYGNEIRGIVDLGDSLLLISDNLMKVAKTGGAVRVFSRIDDTAVAGGLAVVAAKGGGDTILVGTRRGLAVFTGNRWLLVDTVRIGAIFVDSRHSTWVGAASGVFTFEDGKLKPTGPAVSRPGVAAIIEDTAHAIWVATHSGGTFSYDGREWKEQAPIFWNVTAMACWKGTITATCYAPSSGVGHVLFLRNGAWQPADTNGHPFANLEEYTSLAVDSSGNLIVVGTFAGVYRYNGASWAAFDNAPPGHRVYALHCDANGVLWAGTDRDLARCEKNSWQPVADVNSVLPSDAVTSVLAARNGDLWVGTPGGIAVEHGGQWTTLDTCRQRVSCLAEDAQGKIWIGTDSCIYSWGSGAWKRYDTRHSPFPFPCVIGLVPDDSGRAYVSVYSGPGARGAAVGLFDGAAWLPIRSGTYPYAIAADSARGLWIGAGSGDLTHVRFTDRKETGYSGVASLPVFSQNPSGAAWLVCGRGLMKFDGTQWRSVSEIDIPDLYHVRSVHDDGSGAVWVGIEDDNGWGGGFLLRYDSGTWSSFGSQTSRFPQSAVLCVANNNAGKVAFGTCTKGLFVLEPEGDAADLRQATAVRPGTRSRQPAVFLYLGGRTRGRAGCHMGVQLMDLQGRAMAAGKRSGSGIRAAE